MLRQGQRADASSPTWEPIVVKVTQAGDALPEVRVVGAIPGQGQLLLQGPLGNRTKKKMEHKTKQNRTEPIKNTIKNQSHPFSTRPSTGNTWTESQAPKPPPPSGKMSPFYLGSVRPSNSLRHLLLGRRILCWPVSKPLSRPNAL